MISAIELGIVAEMPKPTTMRAPMKARSVGARPHSAVPTVSTVAPARNTLR